MSSTSRKQARSSSIGCVFLHCFSLNNAAAAASAAAGGGFNIKKYKMGNPKF